MPCEFCPGSGPATCAVCGEYLDAHGHRHLSERLAPQPLPEPAAIVRVATRNPEPPGGRHWCAKPADPAEGL